MQVAREASVRALGLRPFDVQIMGGVVLHEGSVAEMRTGEGKTLVAVLPAFLNALAGSGVHIVTVNDYLARRDSEWVGQVHKFLGLEVGLIQAVRLPPLIPFPPPIPPPPPPGRLSAPCPCLHENRPVLVGWRMTSATRHVCFGGTGSPSGPSQRAPSRGFFPLTSIAGTATARSIFLHALVSATRPRSTHPSRSLSLTALPFDTAGGSPAPARPCEA